ncbi:MAG: cadmium resistance transporter [Rhodospirillales bacterium]
MLVVLATALAFASTNLDNLALLIALAPANGFLRVGLAFLLTQAGVILLALLFATGVTADSLPTSWLGWLGLVPIYLGLRELWARWRARGMGMEIPQLRYPSRLATIVLTFGGLSFDTLALTAALLADSAPEVDPQILMGAGLGLAVICLIGILATRMATRVKALTHKLNRATPFIMIAAGLYILEDTVTDNV